MTELRAREPMPEATGPRRIPRMFWLGVYFLVLATLCMVAGPVLGMMQSFDAIKSNPAPTAADITAATLDSMIPTLFGLIVGAIGFVLFLLASIRMARKSHRPV